MSEGSPKGCTLVPLNDDVCKTTIESLVEGKPFKDQPSGLKWLLAHSDGGVTWGRFDKGRWLLASTVFPEFAPPLHADRLQQLRVFGPESEYLLWRTSEGFAGRLCFDGPAPEKSYFKPDIEYRPLLGDRVVATKDGFSHIAVASGRRQAVPLVFASSFQPAFLKMINYFRQDESGAVRVALSRLAGLEFGDE